MLDSPRPTGSRWCAKIELMLARFSSCVPVAVLNFQLSIVGSDCGIVREVYIWNRIKGMSRVIAGRY